MELQTLNILDDMVKKLSHFKLAKLPSKPVKNRGEACI